MSDTPIAYKWGEVLAILDAATPGGISPKGTNDAAERPLTTFPQLHARATAMTPELEKLLQERVAQIDDLPMQLSMEEQGSVYLGYYHLRSRLPYPQARG